MNFDTYMPVSRPYINYSTGVLAQDKELEFLIFLDIDGVLNCTSDFIADDTLDMSSELYFLSHRLVNIFNDFILELATRQVKLDFVISSTWRKGHTLSEIKGIFSSYGLTDINIVGMTGNDPTDHRGTEIQTYIDENYVISRYDGYFILDDDSRDIADTFGPDIFVHICGLDGITLKDLNCLSQLMIAENIY